MHHLDLALGVLVDGERVDQAHRVALAQLAWGTVHLALLPTNEDRAKAVVDWAGAGFTHQRTGRIALGTD